MVERGQEGRGTGKIEMSEDNKILKEVTKKIVDEKEEEKLDL